MNVLARMVLAGVIVCALVPGSVTFADGPSPDEIMLTQQVRLALLEPDVTLGGTLAAYDADVPTWLAAAINMLSLGADPAAFEAEPDDPYLAVIQQVRLETPLLNLTAAQALERVRFYELGRTGYVLMSIFDRPIPSGEMVDLDPEVDILVVVVNFMDTRIGTMCHGDLNSMKVTLHPLLRYSRLPELVGARACHLGCYGVPPRSLAVYVIPAEGA